MHVISITTDGLIRTLHTDHIPLSELGRMTVKRASTVEWRDDLQKWEVATEEHGALFRSKSRAACLRFEKDFFNRRLLAV